MLMDVHQHITTKLNSAEKQLTLLFISVFASDCLLGPTNGEWWAPSVVVGGPWMLCMQGSG